MKGISIQLINNLIQINTARTPLTRPLHTNLIASMHVWASPVWICKDYRRIQTKRQNDNTQTHMHTHKHLNSLDCLTGDALDRCSARRIHHPSALPIRRRKNYLNCSYIPSFKLGSFRKWLQTKQHYDHQTHIYIHKVCSHTHVHTYTHKYTHTDTIINRHKRSFYD